uniref:Bcl-2 Bcl-2 homology region 1-3 domain-containing protein n=1 Tax=Sinocyclocheilus anshuiensis TaxID=1608454 RepID=A0A671QSU5_9TELE
MTKSQINIHNPLKLKWQFHNIKSKLNVAITVNKIEMFYFIMFNFSLIDGFAHVVDRQSFQRLAEKVFVDDITWAKIVTLICVVGKTVAKILANSVPGIVSWTLDYFQNNLQNWICSMGGWINSSSSLAHYSFEREFGSLSEIRLTDQISLSSGVLLISAVLSGFIIWRITRGD